MADLDELERLIAKATWGVLRRDGRHVYHTATEATFAIFYSGREDEIELDEASADAEFYLAIHNAAPSLIATAREATALREEVERLRGEVAGMREELHKANQPHWFYADGHEERCLFSPDDAIDLLDFAAGKYVTEVSTARPCRSIWCAVLVSDDEDADERFTFTEHDSEEAARAALGQGEVG